MVLEICMFVTQIRFTGFGFSYVFYPLGSVRIIETTFFHHAPRDVFFMYFSYHLLPNFPAILLALSPL